jgi:predicted nucleic acid-binding protein
LILIDTSVWVQHLRGGLERAAMLLDEGDVLGHPFVIGELAMGNLRDRKTFLRSMMRLPQAIRADDDEVLGFIERYGLAGLGVGYLDAHLLASARLSDASLWTLDRRLAGVADRLDLGT